MLISIITVCYNSEKTIERTLKSVLDQNYKDYEYIIIDGASSDNTMNIIEKYKNEFNGKLKVFSEPDSGIYDAMNKGIKKCSGDIIGIINSDDYYENDALKIISESYKGNSKHEIYYGMVRFLDNGKEDMVVLFNHMSLDKRMICHPACFVSKDIYDDYGLFDTKYKSAGDYDFMLKIFHNTDTVFFPIYRVLANFSLGGMSSNRIGHMETLEIMHKNGLLSNFRYNYSIFRSCILNFEQQLFKKFK